MDLFLFVSTVIETMNFNINKKGHSYKLRPYDCRISVLAGLQPSSLRAFFAKRAGSIMKNYKPAALRNASALSVLSQVNSGSSRPK